MASQNIYAQYAQPVRSVADYAADYDAQDIRKLQLAGAQRQNALTALTQQEKIAGMSRNALVQAAQRKAAESAGGDEFAYAKNLRLSGFPELIDPADKVDKAATERKAKASENAKRDTETENAVVMQWRDLIGNAVNQQQAAQMVAAMHSDPRIANTPIARVPLDQGLAMLQQTPFDQWKQQFALGAAKFVEMNKPTYQHQNLGGTMQTLALPGMGGAATVAASAPITQSADNRATVGASLANAAAVRDAAKLQADATRAAANTKRDQDTEMKLADDYRAQSKEFGQAKSAHEQLIATLGSATTSPAATLAAATKFMKILDPGSVVRESELGMALAASGVLDRAANYISTLQSGKKLTTTQAADFKMVSNQMFDAAKKVQQIIDADYKSKAKQYGLRPEMVTQDLGQNAGTVPPAVADALRRHGGK